MIVPIYAKVSNINIAQKITFMFKGVFGLEETSVAKDCKTVADFV
jgi:hypothetical protein